MSRFMCGSHAAKLTSPLTSLGILKGSQRLYVMPKDNLEQGRAGQGRAGQGRAGQGRAGQGRAGQGRARVKASQGGLH